MNKNKLFILTQNYMVRDENFNCRPKIFKTKQEADNYVNKIFEENKESIIYARTGINSNTVTLYFDDETIVQICIFEEKIDY